MKKLLLATTVALLPFSAMAANFSLPAEEPVATVTIPDDWNPNAIDTGVEANSPDEMVYIAIEAGDATNIESIIEESFKVVEGKLTVDPASKRESDGNLNGMPAKIFAFDGKDETGDATFTVAIVSVNEQNAIVFTYWGPKGNDTNDATVTGMLNSITKAQ